MLSPPLPRRFIEGDKRIVRLFPDYKRVELGYYRQTGIFPIIHVTVVKQEVGDQDPRGVAGGGWWAGGGPRPGPRRGGGGPPQPQEPRGDPALYARAGADQDADDD